MPLSKEQAKEGIKTLINDFKANYQTHKKELEANTETKLIEPLFEILGWTKNDFVKQEKAHRGNKTGHADYAFYLNDRIVFFLEVKKIGVYLEKEADKQVISYALSKRIPFAVSTNFEQLRIFCVEQEKATQDKFRVFNEPEDYINRFEDLWLLSKESFEQNAILKIAEGEGRLKKRVSINKVLLEDLMDIRKLIASDIEKTYPSKYEINEKDDIIQRIIDRLVFIRRSEDVGINPDNVMFEEVRHLPDNKAYPRLREMFSKYDSVYNAGLFAPAEDNDCDKINIDGAIIKKLAYYLYESKNNEYIYNFDWIDADVLGQVYEQYLGIILSQTKSGRAKLKQGQAHRKEQGIYYTPTYIVDYIVKNTVEELIKNKKVKPQEIKVLDPACGSGSFLIKAFDYIYKNLASNEEIRQQRIDSQGNYSIKTAILKNNLFGVDLDNKATEITKLNLLLKAAEKGRKLPKELDDHIKQGNSLIDDESVVKLNAFKWRGTFQEGSFDVIIGNPPYINAIQLTKTVGEETKNYWKSKYSSAKGTYDIYVLFFEQALNLCKEGGYVSFITPNKYLSSPYGIALREHIAKNYKLVKVVDLSRVKVFDDPSVYPIITVLQKTTPKKEYEIITETIFSENTSKDKQSYKISSKTLTLLPECVWGIILSNNATIIERIYSKSKPLEEVTAIQATSTAAEADEYSSFINEKTGIPIINTGTIDRYSTTYGIVKFTNKGKKLQKPLLDVSKVNEKRKKLYQTPKIILAKLALRIEGFLDKEGKYASINTNCIHTPKDSSLEYLAGLINSKLMSFIYSELFAGLKMSGGYFQFQAPQIRILPFLAPSKENKIKVESLVNQIYLLNKKLNEIGDKKTAETKKIEDELNRIDEEIDDSVYKIYGITKEEKEIIEKS